MSLISPKRKYDKDGKKRRGDDDYSVSSRRSDNRETPKFIFKNGI